MEKDIWYQLLGSIYTHMYTHIHMGIYAREPVCTIHNKHIHLSSEVSTQNDFCYEVFCGSLKGTSVFSHGRLFPSINCFKIFPHGP